MPTFNDKNWPTHLWERIKSLVSGLNTRVTALENGGAGGQAPIQTISLNGTNVAPDVNKNVALVEADPTVPAWAKANTKPTYTASEVGAKAVQSAVSNPTASGSAVAFIDSITQDAQGVIVPTKKSIPSAVQNAPGLMSAADKTKLDGIAAGAQVNSVTGVKGDAENSYRTGDINLTPINVGAIASGMTSVQWAQNGTESDLSTALIAVMETMQIREMRMITLYVNTNNAPHFTYGTTYFGMLVRLDTAWASGFLFNNTSNTMMINRNGAGTSFTFNVLTQNYAAARLLAVDVAFGNDATTFFGNLATMAGNMETMQSVPIKFQSPVNSGVFKQYHIYSGVYTKTSSTYGSGVFTSHDGHVVEIHNNNNSWAATSLN